MIDTCLVLTLYIHGHSYVSKPMFKSRDMYWNNSLSDIGCYSNTAFESECACTYNTIIHVAYDIQKEVQTLPFEYPLCKWLDIPKSYVKHNEIPIFLNRPLRGWSWNSDTRERAWLDIDLCS